MVREVKSEIRERVPDPILQAATYLGIGGQRIDSIAKDVTADQAFNQHRSNEIPVFWPPGEKLARSQVVRLEATTDIAPGPHRITDRYRAIRPSGGKRGGFNRYAMHVKAVRFMESRKLTQCPINPVDCVRPVDGMDVDLD